MVFLEAEARRLHLLFDTEAEEIHMSCGPYRIDGFAETNTFLRK